MLERLKKLGSCATVMLKVAFMAGSSKQGNALLASVGSNTVDASVLRDQHTSFRLAATAEQEGGGHVLPPIFLKF